MTLDNQACTHSCKLIGNERTPLIIADNAMGDLASLRQEIAQCEFGPPYDSPYYPGIRARAHQHYEHEMKTLAERLIRQAFHLFDEATLLDDTIGSYSLLTKTENELIPDQCIPHFDNPAPNHFAVLHYLNEGEFGGTAFYRHKRSGFENISENRVNDYFSSLRESADEHGLPPAKYIAESTALFELIDKVDYVANRLLIYPTRILHSGYIDRPDDNLCADPESGRLTGNFFLSFETSTRAI